MGRGRQCLQTFRAPPVPCPCRAVPSRPVHVASVAATEGRRVASVDATERGAAPRGGRRPQRGPADIKTQKTCRTQLSPYGCSRFNSDGKMLAGRFPTGGKIIKNRRFWSPRPSGQTPKTRKMCRTQLSPYGCSRFNSDGKRLPVRFPTGAKIIKNRPLLVTKRGPEASGGVRPKKSEKRVFSKMLGIDAPGLWGPRGPLGASGGPLGGPLGAPGGPLLPGALGPAPLRGLREAHFTLVIICFNTIMI